MNRRAGFRFRSEKEQVQYAVGLMLRNMHDWRRVLQPLVDDAISDMKDDGYLPVAVATALDDFGEYCRQKGQEIEAERRKLGMGQPAAPDG